MVYASRDSRRTVEAIFVRARRITSTRHGDLDTHTRKGLRVGDRERQLRRLYPNRFGRFSVSASIPSASSRACLGG